MHISVCHRNTVSDINIQEFQFMVTKCDNINLSKTRFKNKKHLLVYGNAPGYKFSYRKRDVKRGVGVQVYANSCISKKLKITLLVLRKR